MERLSQGIQVFDLLDEFLIQCLIGSIDSATWRQRKPANRQLDFLRKCFKQTPNLNLQEQTFPVWRKITVRRNKKVYVEIKRLLSRYCCSMYFYGLCTSFGL